MRKLIYISLLAFAAAASAAASTTINFDNLDGSTGDQVVPNGYGGLNWTNFNVYDAVSDPGGLSPSGYHDAIGGVQGWVSPNNVAFNAFAANNPLTSWTVSSDTVFSLNSVYLHSVWNNGLQVEVKGFLGGFPVFGADETVSLNASDPTPTLVTFDFHFLAVDSVQFIPSGGTPFYTNYYGPYFAMDDMTVNEVPEPGTWLAAALALGVIGFSQRKRVCARARFIKGCASRTVSNN